MTSSSTSNLGSPNYPPPKPAGHSKQEYQRRSPAESALVGGLILCIDAYKAILSPLFLGSCRFEPSCSQFAREALAKHGARGSYLAARRILRCRPFGGFGFDPVP
jgi:putative membrane protein insertion efficiency factor